jgi:hypothetical protein
MLGLYYMMYFRLNRWRRRHDENDQSVLVFDLDQLVHKSLAEEAKTIEYMMVRMEYFMDELVSNKAGEVAKSQIAAIMIAQVAGHIMSCIPVLTRASSAIERQIPAFEQEVELTRELIREAHRKFRWLDFRIVYGHAWDRDYVRVHSRNLYYNGYFPFSPMDKVHY